LRQLVGERVVRGKAEVFIGSEGVHATKRTTFDTELVRAYFDELTAIRTTVSPDATTDLFAHVLRMPDVANTTTDRFTDEEWKGTLALVEIRIADLRFFSPISEGERLHNELAARVDRIGELLVQTQSMDAGSAERTREKLHDQARGVASQGGSGSL
jgi:uncharacterized protein YicC (UPF0701 family)